MGLSLTVSALLTHNLFITTDDRRQTTDTRHALSDNGDAADGVAIKMLNLKINFHRHHAANSLLDPVIPCTGFYFNFDGN